MRSGDVILAGITGRTHQLAARVIDCGLRPPTAVTAVTSGPRTGCGGLLVGGTWVADCWLAGGGLVVGGWRGGGLVVRGWDGTVDQRRLGRGPRLRYRLSMVLVSFTQVSVSVRLPVRGSCVRNVYPYFFFFFLAKLSHWVRRKRTQVFCYYVKWLSNYYSDAFGKHCCVLRQNSVCIFNLFPG